MKYSVIIPAYNVETTLRRCMDSIVGQLPQDAEVLLINDGSDDGTEIVCKEYAESYPQIRFVSKPNGGVSSARNVGLDNASGEYILFVDADDAVREDYFKILDKALQCSPDMLLFRKQLMGDCRQCLFYDDGGVLYDDIQRSGKYLSRCLREQQLNLITTKAFRREIIEKRGLRFDERLDIGEDKAFAFAFSLHAEKVKSIRTPLYHLSVEDPDSLSRRKRDHLCESALLEHRLMAEMLQNSPLAEKIKENYKKALCYSFYRSAYTVVGELRKYDLTKADRVNRVKGILEAYSNEPMFKPEEFRCRVIAYPVRKKWAKLIDAVMRFFLKWSGI